MRWREAWTPRPMARVALVAPAPELRAALVRVADAGTVELDRIVPVSDQPMPRATSQASGDRGQANGDRVPPRLSATAPDLGALARAGRADLLAGEAELAGYAADAVVHGPVAALLGWVPADALPDLAARLADVGAAAVPLPAPKGIDPPSVRRPGAVRQGFDPLVRTYAEVPYVDVDPSVAAGLAYVVMFGAMFGDVGHGALLVLAALAIRAGWLTRLRGLRGLRGLRPYWLFVLGAGLSSALFGLGYGECFGPTGLVPTWWLAPMANPVPLLVGGVALGALLLAGAYALGTVNRCREGGWALALYASSGVAGSLVFLAAAVAATAWVLTLAWLGYLAAVIAFVGLALAYLGLRVDAGRGAAGTMQAAVELFDMVVRLGANVVSFARLAAFGLTHAVLGWIVWDATTGLWRHGWPAAVAAVVVFAAGNAVALGLEALVAGVQALRLEYYELFSRVFAVEGRPFRPWHVPLDVVKEESCMPG